MANSRNTSTSTNEEILSDYDETCVVPKSEIIRFVKDSLESVGLSNDNADSVAHHLMYADTMGIFSHGLRILPRYMNDVKLGLVEASAEPEIFHDYMAVALVDGCNGFGQVVGKYCMRMAIEKAHRFGIGFVCARGSNHFGICGYYTRMAMERGMIGFACTNSSPLMAPPHSKVRAMGSNPLSLGMSAHGGDHFLLDMATTTVSKGKMEYARKRDEKIPAGWAIDAEGNFLTDAKVACETGNLVPLGNSSSFKGFGLAIMVEILCGILSGSDFGPNIRNWTDHDRIANLGHAFIAIYPDVFSPGSRNRLAHLLTQLREMETIGVEPVLVPGDKERIHAEKVDKQGGVTYLKSLMEDFYSLAEEYKIEPPGYFKKRSMSMMRSTSV